MEKRSFSTFIKFFLIFMQVQEIEKHKAMRFQLVDKITQVQPLKRIEGIKRFSSEEASIFQYSSAKATISPAFIVEAAGQLGSWLIKAGFNFVFEPLIAYVEDVSVFKEIFPECPLHLIAKILSYDDNASNLLLKAYEGNELVMRIDRAMFAHLSVGDRYRELSHERFNALLAGR
jgi:hypothetical protein